MTTTMINIIANHDQFLSPFSSPGLSQFSDLLPDLRGDQPESESICGEQKRRFIEPEAIHHAFLWCHCWMELLGEWTEQISSF